MKETTVAAPPLERATRSAVGNLGAAADPAANLREAARQGADALYALAQLSETGRGAVLDPRAAYDLYARAAAMGHPAALYKLAIIHGDRGTEADRNQAKEYLTRAARLGHAGAQRELLRLQGQQPTVSGTSAPSYAIARAARGQLVAIEAADQAARLAQLRLRRAFTEGTASDLRTAWAASLAAEAQLDRLRDVAWANVLLTTRTPVLLSEALQLAFLDLQIEARRRVGPLAHTVVPGLEQAPGCAGDIVADRLVASYGRQVSSLLADASNADETSLLHRLASQMACLGERQMVSLEWGLGSGFVEVEARMRSGGLERLVPAFARLMAPLQVLVMDTQKHRGARSYAYQWFALYQPELQAAIAQGGWAARGGVGVWNRVTAGMLVMPTCPAGARSPDCVDTLAFLRSLADPRALGFGDCALSGMITAGYVAAGQDASRYTCPSLGCDKNGAPRSDSENVQWTQDQLTADHGPWPEETGSDVLPPNQSLCRSPSDQNFQGAGGNLDICLDPFAERPANPWDAYASCMAEGLGDGGDPIPFGQLAGVPTGRRCNAFSSGPGFPLPGTSAHTAGRVRVDINAAHRPERPAGSDAGTPDTGSTDATMPDLPELKGTETSGTSPSREQLNDKLKQEIQAKIADPSALKTKEDIDKLAGEVERAVQEGAMSDEEGQATLEGLQTLREGAQDCVDIGGCVNDCSALGAQISRVNGCTDQLLDAFSEAIGRPRSRPSGDRKPQDWVSYPVPDDGGATPGAEDSSCMSDTGPNRQPAACGLMLCTNSTLGSANPEEMNTCSCGQSAAPVRLTTRLCQALDCGPDAEQMDDCSCQPLDGGDVTPPSGPGPIDHILFGSARSTPVLTGSEFLTDVDRPR